VHPAAEEGAASKACVEREQVMTDLMNGASAEAVLVARDHEGETPAIKAAFAAWEIECAKIEAFAFAACA
jgi:hypothetical protein